MMNRVKGEMADQTLALLHTKFVVPLVMRDMLSGAEVLDDIAEYELQDFLGGLEPDAALICLALCAQHISAWTSFVPMGVVLGQEAGRLIEEYGPAWLAHDEHAQDLDEDDVQTLLLNLPEDLEALGDLFLATCGELNHESAAIAAILTDILGTQAHMHAGAAEVKLESLNLMDFDRDDDGLDLMLSPEEALAIAPATFMTDIAMPHTSTVQAAPKPANVIRFPAPANKPF